MGKAKQERELTLLARVDEGVIKRSIARMNDLSRGFNAVADAEVRLDRANAKAESSLGNLTGETNDNISALRKRIAITKLDIQAQEDALGITRKQTSAIEQQTRAQDKLNKERQQSSGISGAERAGNISSFAGSIGTLAGGSSPLGGAFNAIADITQVIEYLPQLSEALTGVKAAGGAAQAGAVATSVGIGSIVAATALAAPALIALTVTIHKFTKTIAEAKEGFNNAITAQERYFELIQSGTREGIENELELARLKLAFQQDEIRRIEEAAAAQDAFGKAVFELAGGKAALDELKDSASASQLEIETLNRALQSTEVRSREAARAQEELSAALLKHVEGAIDEEIKYQELVEKATREQVEDRIAAIQRETDAIERQLERLLAPGETTPEALEASRQLEERLAALTAEEQRLTGEVIEAVAAREKETAAIEAQKEALEKAGALEQARAEFEESLAALEAKTLAERKAIIQRTNNELIKIEIRRLEQVGKLERDFSTSEARAERDFNLSIEKLQRDSTEQEESIKADSASRINDLEERAARERQRIIADFNDAASDAIQNRDAVALDAAIKTRNRALKENDRDLKQGTKQEKAALKERLEEARRSNAQRIQDLRASYAIERADRYADFQQRLADINAQAEQERALTQTRQTEAIAALEARNREELDTIKASFADQLSEYNTFYTNLQNKTAAELAALALKWQTYFENLAAVTPSGSTAGGWQGATGGTIQPTPAARGIRGFRNGTLLAGEGGRPELMRVKHGAVDVLSGGGTRSVFSGMGRAMQQSMATVSMQRTLNIAPGAFQANLSGADPARMALEIERRVAKRLPVLFEQMLEAELGNG